MTNKQSRHNRKHKKIKKLTKRRLQPAASRNKTVNDRVEFRSVPSCKNNLPPSSPTFIPSEFACSASFISFINNSTSQPATPKWTRKLLLGTPGVSNPLFVFQHVDEMFKPHKSALISMNVAQASANITRCAHAEQIQRDTRRSPRAVGRKNKAHNSGVEHTTFSTLPCATFEHKLPSPCLN